MTYILGISAFFHDSSATLIKDGEILTAVQEERFTRVKHDSNFPINSIKFILNENKISLTNIDYVSFQDKPLIKFERLIETYISEVPKGFKSFRKAMPLWIKEKLFQKNIINKELKKLDRSFKHNKIMFSEHHAAHAASAFYPSPFEEALILTIDGVGEWATSTISIGKKNKINIVKEINFPHSLGLLYSAFTFYTGFKVNSGEYKLMGLAPYGKPIYADKIKSNIISIKDDGSFRLNLKYFDFMTGLEMTNAHFNNLFGSKNRKSENEQITQFHMDIAASIQSVTEEIILKITRSIYAEYKIPNLCLAGGVALNCVANGKILKDGFFKNIWIQPASGDAGGSLGSAMLLWHQELNKKRIINTNDSMRGSYLGPSYKNTNIKNTLAKLNASFNEFDDDILLEKVTEELINGKVVGWFQGKMEFGPRALGARSIIADPRAADMQKKLNLKIKYRESFRPFAPSILFEDLEEWFDMNQKSPYMLLVSDILKNKRFKIDEYDKSKFGIDKLNLIRSEVPSITHVDFSARIQTVHMDTNKRYYELINKFKQKTGCPILINTSFNIRGEPIVCTPEDAFNCFMGTEMDCLVIENHILFKTNQSKDLLKDYRNKFDLD